MNQPGNASTPCETSPPASDWTRRVLSRVERFSESLATLSDDAPLAAQVGDALIDILHPTALFLCSYHQTGWTQVVHAQMPEPWTEHAANICGEPVVGYRWRVKEDCAMRMLRRPVYADDDAACLWEHLGAKVGEMQELAGSSRVHVLVCVRGHRLHGFALFVSPQHAMVPEVDELGVLARMLSLVWPKQEGEPRATEVSRSDGVPDACARTLIDALSASMFVLDARGTVIAANTCGAARLGTSPDELVGNAIFDFMPAAAAALRRHALAEVVCTQMPHQFEEEHEGIIIENHLFPIPGPTGEIDRVAVLGTDVSRFRLAEMRLSSTVEQLKLALANVRTLRGLLPICWNCKKIRDDSGYWRQVEHFLSERTDAEFSHGICPECAHILYPGTEDD